MTVAGRTWRTGEPGTVRGEAALMRFVTRDTTMALPRGRGTKRKAPHGPAVREALLELTGDPFHLLVCGRGRSLKDDTREPW